jgi:beta-lactamase class C
MTAFVSRRLALALTVSMLVPLRALAQEPLDQGRLDRVVGEAIRPILDEHGVPGLAVGVTAGGQRSFFSYGVASKESGQRVTQETIFEIGSVSKAFTATLAAYAEARGTLSLSDPASRHWPALAGSGFDRISLLDLGTYAAGGLPLQFPDEVTDRESLIAYLRNWRPASAAGTHRRYSNPSIGLFGHLAARSMNRLFDELMEQELFRMLGLSRTFISVPRERMGDYAWGTSRDGKPIRVAPGPLASEAYGVKATAADLIRFVEANIAPEGLDPALRRAITATQTGYYQVGPMTQGLGWEIYAPPMELDRLLAGNASDMALKAHEVRQLDPPMSPQASALINKTGSTNGFGAYVAFIPVKRIGVVLLANRNYPIPARVRAAHAILTALDGSAKAP